MKLYSAPKTRAVRARWLMEELGVPYELVQVDPARPEEYLRVHPLGDVPALVDGNVTLLESLGICLHLADRFPEKHLAPPVGSPERGAYYQWMTFAEMTLDPLVVGLLQQAPTKPPARLKAVLDVIDAGLGEREVLVGEAFSAADVVMASILHLAHTLRLLDGHPRLFDYVRRHTQRPAVRRAVSP
jgi:glutathione S-transferase